MPKPSKKFELIPPDEERCQAEKPNGYTFMTLGGVPGVVRCENRPTVIVRERLAGKDGRCGSMSLCHDCLQVLIDQAGPDYFEVVRTLSGGD